MDFDFSFEQRSLAEGIRRLLQDFPAANELPPHAYPAGDVIARLAEFGLFGDGDEPSPLGHTDLVAIAIEAGRTIVAAPVVETVAASIAFGAQLGVPAGSLIGVGISGAIGEGSSAVVAHGAQASVFVVPHRQGGARGWVLAKPDDLDITPIDTMDITADAVRVRLRDGAKPTPLATNASDMGDLLRLACLAEIVGSAEAMLERTVAYVADRKQFGKPIGTNQAVKHMAADCAVAVETMKAAIEYAGWSADCALDDEAMVAEARLALLSAASFVGEHGRRVAERCVQMHGGIAFTWDYGLHVPLRRILFRTATVAVPRTAREALASHLLDQGA